MIRSQPTSTEDPINLLHQRNYVSPKVIENYTLQVGEINRLASILIECGFDLSKKPVDVQVQFKLNYLTELKTKLIKSYLLLKEFLTSNFDHLKSLIYQYNEIESRLETLDKAMNGIDKDVDKSSLIENKVMNLDDEKEHVKSLLSKLEDNTKELDKIDTFLQDWQRENSVTIHRSSLLECFDNDEEKLNWVLKDLPLGINESRYNKDIYKFKIQLTASVDFLQRMNKVTKGQIKLVQESVDNNKKAWKELSTRLSALSQQLLEIV